MFGVGLHRFPLEILAPVEEPRKDWRGYGGRRESLARPAVLGRLRLRVWASRLKAFPLARKAIRSSKTGAAGAQRGRTEEAAIATWSIDVSELKPTRNSVHAVFSREDDLRNPGLQAALTRDLRMAVSDAVDLAVFEGDSNANEDAADITGLGHCGGRE